MTDLPYGGEPPSQKHSPTSKEAARRIKKCVGKDHRAILTYLQHHPEGATDERLGEELALGGNTLRPRRRELQLMDHIVDSGRQALTHSGRHAVVWIVKGDKNAA